MKTYAGNEAGKLENLVWYLEKIARKGLVGPKQAT